ncbi:hypothetical protein Poly21_41850 [Allorhodopirellula heiligendammensis]|uniref:Uncharacterized protein n=1 Tax=Allorhodopirellula heiligendammensis TaxID=2714739 RepID=A0A5C6C0D3_9BACT|nr:hypothetical protein Poly21_41850 [Allorhodopirellula heiligendammensis]
MWANADPLYVLKIIGRQSQAEQSHQREKPLDLT